MMPDNDVITHFTHPQSQVASHSAEFELITLERARKLDLLIHLIANLKQSLVVCGAEGIGKTKLLTAFTQRKQDVWGILAIQGSVHLSFERVQDQLLQFLTHTWPDYQQRSLSDTLNTLDKHHKKMVIIIDDAGVLVPGLIHTLIQYAAGNECLRVIFALTHDELNIKSNSDRAIDDCHVVEIPPLTVMQCGLFLQHLAAQGKASLSFRAVNDSIIEKLYQQTHGIPGRIIANLAGGGGSAKPTCSEQ